MEKEIKFQDNNHLSDEKRKDWNDLEWIDEFYCYLQGEKIENVGNDKPFIKLSQKKAFHIIWFLQEHLRILPDNIERCSICGELYDSNSSGLYWETKGKFYCNSCSDQVPYNYDRRKK